LLRDRSFYDKYAMTEDQFWVFSERSRQAFAVCEAQNSTLQQLLSQPPFSEFDRIHQVFLRTIASANFHALHATLNDRVITAGFRFLFLAQGL